MWLWFGYGSCFEAGIEAGMVVQGKLERGERNRVERIPAREMPFRFPESDQLLSLSALISAGSNSNKIQILYLTMGQ